MKILRKINHVTLQFDLCVSVMVTKYSQSASLNWKLSFVWRQILISFSRKSHSGQPVVHPWESLEWSPWFAGIPLNWSWIGGLSIAARPVEKLARALCSKISSEKLNWTESRDRLHTHLLLRCCLHNQSFYHRRKISRADMSPHLLLGGWWCKALVTGGWWARSTQLARWVAVYWQAHPPSSDGHRPTARPVEPPHSSHLLAETLTTKIRKLLTKGKSLSQLMTRQEY